MSLNIQFSPEGWEDHQYWLQSDKKTLKKINELIKDAGRNASSGIGKPEPLKHALAGWWSRRITDEHRMVYKVDAGTLKIAQLRYHYE